MRKIGLIIGLTALAGPALAADLGTITLATVTLFCCSRSTRIFRRNNSSINRLHVGNNYNSSIDRMGAFEET